MIKSVRRKGSPRTPSPQVTPKFEGPDDSLRTRGLCKLQRANDLPLAPILFTSGNDSTKIAASKPRKARKRSWWLLIPTVVTILVILEPCVCLYGGLAMHNHQFNMEPAPGSIFGSLMSNSGSSNNEQASAQSAQQSADQQHQHYKNGQMSDKVTLPGDILLGGLFPIHMKGTKIECGEINRDRGIQRLEAMLYALDRINEDSRLLPEIRLGAILLDSCSSSTYALNQSLEFIRASINTVESSAFECKDKSSPRPKYGSKMIAGVIGGSYSEVSLQVANLLRLFRIPQVSYASTGTALSDKTLYDLFARTVPSDMFQARAIADIVLKLNWSYVSLVSSEGLYGDSGSKEFIKQASIRNICIATHEKISPTMEENSYDSIIANLQKRNATGVVLFTRAEDTRELLLAVKRAKLFQSFAWVAADGWGTHQKLVEGVEEVAWGAITVELQAKAIPGFDQYMKALTPWANARNPWFSEYWQEWFDCQLQANLVQQQQVAAGLQGQPSQPYLSDGYSDSAGDSERARRSVRNSSQLASGPTNNKSSGVLKRPTRSAPDNGDDYSGPDESMKQFCSPNLRISETNGYRQEQKVQFVVDAVYAMAHALHEAWFNLCDGQPGVVCEALKELNGGEFYSKYLLNVSFLDLAGSEVKFDERGDGLGRYNIYNFRQIRSADNHQPYLEAMAAAASATGDKQQQDANYLVPQDDDGRDSGQAASSRNSQLGSPSEQHIYPQANPVAFEYSSIGRWTENDYILEMDQIEFIQGRKVIPESYCSRPCELGQAKIMRAGDHCCWICKTCAPYEFLPDEFSCQDCGIGRWPVQNKTSCFNLDQKHLKWDSIYSIISLTIACLGIALTIFVSIIFIKFIDTPVVKASGRELSFILLSGIACCHMSTFVLLSKPTAMMCGTQRFLVNFGFSLMYASLLVKTNRIARIFNCARKSAKRPSFISPRSQVLITGILVAIQIFLTIVWFVFEPPGVRADSPEGKRDEVILKCRVKGKSFILSLVYNMLLITTCTIYAVKTRKIPENFNESKFIGFTMYTTIVIWLAFVTMFFGTNNSYEIQINTMCVCISLSAYVTLFCLFSPKVSIILLHPDKNVRKLTMNSATYKRPFKPVSSMASLDGRYANTAGGVSSALNQTGQAGLSYNGLADAHSGGLISNTSNVLNLADSQRLQESSIISNAPNSTSQTSQCSGSKTLSQQHLALVQATCLKCGSTQLTSQQAAGESSTCPTSQSGAKLMQTRIELAPSAASNQVKLGSDQALRIASGLRQVSAAVSNLVVDERASSLEHLTDKAESKQDWCVSQANNSSSNNNIIATNSSQYQQQQQQAHLIARQKMAEKRQTSVSVLNEFTATHVLSMPSAREHPNRIIHSNQIECLALAHSCSSPNRRQSIATVLGDERLDSNTRDSDSSLWKQSVLSVDYCSDCCPSSCCHMGFNEGDPHTNTGRSDEDSVCFCLKDSSGTHEQHSNSSPASERLAAREKNRSF